jgi:uncharacterized linocin/CFP29 family protein
MDDRNAQVGWTEAQWNRVSEEVLKAWQRVRVAGSFLPVYGPLPPSTEVVPSEVLKPDGTVDDQATSVLIEIALPVTLTRQEVQEEDLSSALLQFRRRATQVGQLEDWFVFNGTYPSVELPAKAQTSLASGAEVGRPFYRPSSAYLDDLIKRNWAAVQGTPRPIADQDTQKQGLRGRNPGALGLIEGPRVSRDEEQAQKVQKTQRPKKGKKAKDKLPQLNNDGLMLAVVNAIDSLEENGFVAPYVCVFGRNAFEAAHRPIDRSTVFPRDRLEPLIGRELLHASAIDVVPHESQTYPQLSAKSWRSRGVLLSMADEAVDLAVAAEATPEFRQVDGKGRYLFAVFERFALRVKDSKALAPLNFRPR